MKNMPIIKYIGRKSFFRGNTLFWLIGHLRDLGLGRVFVKNKEFEFPEKSYYRLTRVVSADFSDPNLRHGEAWAEQIYRGKNMGEIKITEGHKKDWKLIAKEEEEEFCPIDNVYEEVKHVPKYIPFPPLLGAMLQTQNKLNHKPLVKTLLPESAEGLTVEEFDREFRKT